MTTLFISDLHLSPSRPKLTALFVKFLQTKALTSKNLYILGDLFDLWIGDDNKNKFYITVTKALSECSNSGVNIYIMPGNRDFFIGTDFADAAKAYLISEPKVILIHGKRILILHGDLLCAADKSYQVFRKIVRHPISKNLFLSLPLTIRKMLAKKIQGATKKVSAKNISENPAIADVTDLAVMKMMREHYIYYMIHGHTHQPDIHQFICNKRDAKRIVLGDWSDTKGSVLVYNKTGETLEGFV